LHDRGKGVDELRGECDDGIVETPMNVLAVVIGTRGSKSGVLLCLSITSFGGHQLGPPSIRVNAVAGVEANGLVADIQRGGSDVVVNASACSFRKELKAELLIVPMRVCSKLGIKHEARGKVDNLRHSENATNAKYVSNGVKSDNLIHVCREAGR
jgi:hypothetical protein